jgi:uncharacterized protein YkwD
MGRIGVRGVVIGTALVVAVAAVSASALVFEGRGESSSEPRPTVTSSRHTATTTSTSTTTSTTTTTTTAPPPVTAAPAPAPVEVPAPAAAPVAPACDGSGSAVISAMNGDRAANGLGALCGNGQLAGIAQNWANWMAQNGSLTHQDLDGVLAGTAFSTVAENILVGPGGMSPEQMETAWMQSAPHRANILSGAYSAAGVGIASGSDGRIWVAVDFGG